LSWNIVKSKNGKLRFRIFTFITLYGYIFRMMTVVISKRPVFTIQKRRFVAKTVDIVQQNSTRTIRTCPDDMAAPESFELHINIDMKGWKNTSYKYRSKKQVGCHLIDCSFIWSRNVASIVIVEICNLTIFIKTWY